MKSFISRVLTTSLAIFAMLFGAGNLIFPLRIGVESAGHIFTGFFGFALTGILLPILGLMAIVSFQGDYLSFFGRLGKWPRHICIFLCMMIMGPFIATPRIMDLSYEMTKPFLPSLSLPLFTILFAFIAFITTYRLNRLLDIIGKYLSPTKIISIIAIIVAGLITAHPPILEPIDRINLFWNSLIKGYATLDLIGAIFFGSIVVQLLATYSKKEEQINLSKAVRITAISGLFAGLLLGIVYLGITSLGAFHSQGITLLNEGEIFSAIAFRILGNAGAAILALIVLLAGLTTLVSISAVVGEYVQTVSHNYISYAKAVGLVLLISAFVANSGLTLLLSYSEPFINFFYPLIITITVCNLLYKFYGFTWIKLPVLLTALLSGWIVLRPLFF